MPMKIDPWGEAIPKDYARLMDEFGIEPFEALIDEIPNPHHLMRRKVIFGHRDFGRVLDAMRKGKDFAVMTGLMPSGRMHLGHKLVVDQLIWYQERGADIYLCVADLESHATRGLTLEEARKLAIDEYLLNFQALGLDLRKCNLYFQSRSDVVRNLAYTLGRKVNFSEMRAIYGFAGESNVAHIFYPMIDIADILHPQLKEFGGPRPTVVPVGIDQDPHLRLARDVAGRFKHDFKFIPPSSTYHRLMPGLTGKKMSSSRPETAIFLTDSVRDVRKKIMDAFTGGQPTAKEQRKKGGNPDKCVVYGLYVYHLMPDDEELLELREACKSGELICGDCKARAIELMGKFLGEQQERRERARSQVEKYVEE
ncbi:MAG: tryptophan--tRNA ligase [Candidatus Hadarchaeota archaeon]|nr:tryptophan--tRNA ligase [Candidatus Hadarchaeota archaeon]